MRVLYDGLRCMVLEKDVAVVEGMRHLDLAAGEFSTKFTEALYAWNNGAGIKLPEPDPEVINRWGSQWFIYPNIMFHPLYGNAIGYRVRPDTDDPEHCYFEMWSLTLYPEGEDPGKPEFEGVFEADDDTAWPLIPRQDFSNIARQQRGLHTPGYKANRLSRKFEDGIANMHVHLDTYLAR